jgi:arylsulfatase A-like enzyme
MMWRGGIASPGRVEESFVSFTDLAPTYLELARVSLKDSGMQPMEGRSMTPIFQDALSGPFRDHMLIGKERHDVGRPDDHGYPIRGIVTDRWLYVRNFEPSRWPAGHPRTGYLNSDGCPTKTAILDMRREGTDRRYWRLCFGKRPDEELYDLQRDPDCLNNLADDEPFAAIKDELSGRMERELREQEDPRILGRGEVFDEYLYANPGFRDYYNRYVSGEELPEAGWVNPSDYEEERLD